MGATFLEETLDGKLTADQVRKQFDQMSSDAAHRSGNEYSGDWNMCSGISVRPEKVFPSYKEAVEWLDQNCQKWENAIAVRYKHSKTTVVKEPTYNGKKASEHGFQGEFGEDFRIAVKSFYPNMTAIVMADQLTEAQKTKGRALINAYLETKKAHVDSVDALRSLTNLVNDLSVDFKDYARLRLARSKATLARRAYVTAMERLKDYNAERSPKLYEKKTDSDGERWAIGGIAAE